MLENKTDGRAMIQFFTIATGIESFCLNTFPDFTIIAAIAAIGEFRAIDTATRAINSFRSDLRCVVHDTPFLSGFFS